MPGRVARLRRRARPPARPPGRRLLAAAVLVAGLATLAAGGTPAPAAGPRVLVATVDGGISPVTAAYLDDGLEKAEDGGYDAYVVRLDTPGGLDTSMRAIVKDFLGARVPVVVYVSPAGARAASAGAIITFAAHVAAMAPGTAIGAATPIDLEGGDLSRKIVNDAAALAESVAAARGRNVEFARDTVREGRSAPAEEAAEIGAVDRLASSLPDLLDQIHGTEVVVGPQGARVVLRTRGAAVDDFDMGLLRRIQQVLADPEIAFLLLSLGTLGIIYELATPGIGAGGTVGIISIVLALFALSVLPVSAVGLLLLLLAAVLFVLELFAPGIGVAAAGGTFALALSGVFLFRDTPGLGVSLALVIPMSLVMFGAVVFAGRLVVRSRRREPLSTGPESLLGRELEVRRADDGRGQVFAEGAWWNVRRDDGRLEPGQRVRVVGVEGLELTVEPAPPPAGEEGGAT